MAGREQKIADLLKLIKGEISPEDLKPKRFCMAIGYSEDPIYLINEKEVSEDVYKKHAAISPNEYGTGIFDITYGELEGHQFVDDELSAEENDD
jgi:hypothetical protein